MAHRGHDGFGAAQILHSVTGSITYGYRLAHRGHDGLGAAHVERDLLEARYGLDHLDVVACGTKARPTRVSSRTRPAWDPVYLGPSLLASLGFVGARCGVRVVSSSEPRYRPLSLADFQPSAMKPLYAW